MNSKGQVSFEVLLITMIIFIMVLGIANYYLAIADSTLAMQLAKVDALDKISASGETCSIEKIDFTESGTNLALTIKTDCSFTAADFSKTIDRIKNKTKYDTVTITVT